MKNINEPHQFDLAIGSPATSYKAPEIVDMSIIRAIPTKREALRATINSSPYSMEQVADHLNMDKGNLSKIINDKGKNFPDEKLTEFMNFCRNLIPIQWEAYQAKTELKIIETELETKFRISIEEGLEKDLKLKHYEEIFKILHK